MIRRWLLRNPTAPEILQQLSRFAGHGLQFHTQIVMSPGVNDGAVLGQTLGDLYDLGPSILSGSVVPVGLTEFSKHTGTGAHGRRVSAIAVMSNAGGSGSPERGVHWVFGADELYLRAGARAPAGDIYDEFEQMENGVGSVRFHQRPGPHRRPSGWAGKRIGIVTGTSMGQLMPMVLEPLQTHPGGARADPVGTAFRTPVTTAGLLPGRPSRRSGAARPRPGACCPASRSTTTFSSSTAWQPEAFRPKCPCRFGSARTSPTRSREPAA